MNIDIIKYKKRQTLSKVLSAHYPFGNHYLNEIIDDILNHNFCLIRLFGKDELYVGIKRKDFIICRFNPDICLPTKDDVTNTIFNITKIQEWMNEQKDFRI